MNHAGGKSPNFQNDLQNITSLNNFSNNRLHNMDVYSKLSSTCYNYLLSKIYNYKNPKLCEETGKRQKLPLLQPFKLKAHFQEIVITGTANT